MDFFSSNSYFKKCVKIIDSKTFSVNFLLFVDVNFGAKHFCSLRNKKVRQAQFWLISCMSNIFVYRGIEMLRTKIHIYKLQEID